jgi:hypothetical protein
LGVVYHQYCSSSYLDLSAAGLGPSCCSRQWKSKLDTNKAARASIAIAVSYALGQVSKSTEYPQLAFANSIALIIIIAILYINRPAPLAKKQTPLACK